MNEFFKSLKDDLSDRRMLPLVAVAAVALVVAIGFVALGGGSSSSTPAPTATPLARGAAGIAVTQSAPGSEHAVAETTDGAKSQRHGSARDPFSVLPGTETKVAVATVSGAGSATSKASSESSAASGSAGGKSTSSPKTETTKPTSSTPSTGVTPKSSKQTTVFSVALEFGQLPPPGSGITPQLTPYPSLTKPTPLPSHTTKLIEFLGVSGADVAKGGGGKEATFALATEAILHGNGVCRPSPVQCSLISLKVGQAEQLEFFSTSGLLAAWELRVTAITTDTRTVTTSATTRALRAQASNGRTALLASAGLRWSSRPGVIVTVHPRSSAHSAAHAHR
jgi:hypothetical protein